MADAEVPPRARMLQIASSNWVAKPLWVVAQLGIADRLADGAKTTERLARETATHEPSLYRVLRALASIGVFRETAPRTFALAPLGETLRSDAPDSLRDVVIFHNHPLHDRIWAEFMHSVRTGAPAAEKATGLPIFEYFEKNPDFGEAFKRAMTALARSDVAGVAACYDFSGIGRLVDVGGGHGALMCALLERYPQMRGVVFDQTYVVAGTRRMLAERGLGARCEVVGGDFFESVPAGDAVILSHIVHDWDDARCAMLLRNVRESLPPGGRVLICEAVVPTGDEFSPAKFLDLEMLAMPGGCERTREEFAALLVSAGFALHRVVATQTAICVIEGVRA